VEVCGRCRGTSGILFNYLERKTNARGRKQPSGLSAAKSLPGSQTEVVVSRLTRTSLTAATTREVFGQGQRVDFPINPLEPVAPAGQAADRCRH
jgi:phosphohistidine phosphatase SixA